MKFFALLVFFVVANFNAQGAEKASRKPANSAWVDCTAYSADGWQRLTINVGQGDPAVTVFGSPKVDIVDSDNECHDDLFCNMSKNLAVKVKLAIGDEATINLHAGKVKQKSDWSRGEAKVYEIEPVVDIKDKDGKTGKMKMFGTCMSYNM